MSRESERLEPGPGLGACKPGRVLKRVPLKDSIKGSFNDSIDSIRAPLQESVRVPFEVSRVASRVPLRCPLWALRQFWFRVDLKFLFGLPNKGSL